VSDDTPKVPAQLRQLSSAVEIVFLPSPDQRKAKAAFYVKAANAPVEPSQITLAQAIQFTNDSRLEFWWRSTGFRDWFTNSDELDQRLDYLIQLGLDAVEELFLDPNPKVSSAKVNGLKLLMEARGKLAARTTQIKFADEHISRMSPAELKSYIEKNKRLLGT